jgi:hypothetical protein
MPQRQSDTTVPFALYHVTTMHCLDPFGTVECGESFDEYAAGGDGDEVCFGNWNLETSRIDFGSKMPTNVELFLFRVMRIRTWCSRPTFTRAAASQSIQTGRRSLPRIALLPTRLWSISTMLRRPVLLVSIWQRQSRILTRLQINSTMRSESSTLMSTLTSTLPTVDATAMRRVHPRFLPHRHWVSNTHSCPCLHFVMCLIVSHFSLVCYSSCSL